MTSISSWLDLASCIGIAVLAVPVWSLNLRRRRVQELRDADHRSKTDTGFRATARTILIDKHKRNVEDWHPVDQICLWVGYGALLGSAFARLLLPAP